MKRFSWLVACLVALGVIGALGAGGAEAIESPRGVATEPATRIRGGFELHGELNPGGSRATYYFPLQEEGAVECEDLEGCGESTGRRTLKGSTEKQGKAAATHLSPDTRYVFWLVVHFADQGRVVVGEQLTFTTTTLMAVSTSAASDRLQPHVRATVGRAKPAKIEECCERADCCREKSPEQDELSAARQKYDHAKEADKAKYSEDVERIRERYEGESIIECTPERCKRRPRPNRAEEREALLLARTKYKQRLAKAKERYEARVKRIREKHGDKTEDAEREEREEQQEQEQLAHEEL